MTKITEMFKIGDKVEWIKIRQNTNGYAITSYKGEIVEIVDSKAKVKSLGYNHLVSLFELKVIK